MCLFNFSVVARHMDGARWIIDFWTGRGITKSKKAMLFLLNFWLFIIHFEHFVVFIKRRAISFLALVERHIMQTLCTETFLFLEPKHVLSFCNLSPWRQTIFVEHINNWRPHLLKIYQVMQMPCQQWLLHQKESSRHLWLENWNDQ